MSKSVAIVGGGVAGIAAAAALSDAGLEVQLFEKRPLLGGRASSFLDHQTGQRTDECQHGTMRCCANLADLLERLGVHDQIQYFDALEFLDGDGRRSQIRGCGLPAPAHTAVSFLRFKSLGIADKIAISRAMLAMLRTPPTAEWDALSIEAWFQKMGQTERAVKRFWRPILVSACNEDLARISAANAFKIFRDGFLLNARAFHFGLSKVPLGTLYHEPAINYLQARNACVRVRTIVDRIEVAQTSSDVPTPDPNRQHATHSRHPIPASVSGIVLNDGERIEADYYISALQCDLLLKILPPEVTAGIPYFENLREIEFSPIAGIHLWFNKVLDCPASLALLDRKTEWIFNKNKIFGLPDGEGTYLSMVISASHDLAALPKEELIALVLADVRACVPGARDAEVVKSYVIRWPKATISPKAGAEALRPAQVSPLSNLFIAGGMDANRLAFHNGRRGAKRLSRGGSPPRERKPPAENPRPRPETRRPRPPVGAILTVPVIRFDVEAPVRRNLRNRAGKDDAGTCRKNVQGGKICPMRNAIDNILRDLEELVRSGQFAEQESDTLEIKPVPPTNGDWRERQKSVNAFLNTRGGILILGIKEEGQGKDRRYVFTGYQEYAENKIKGLAGLFTDKDKRKLEAADSFPSPEIRPFLDGRVALVFVDEISAEKKYAFLDGKAYRRILTGEHEIKPAEIDAQEEYKQESWQARELQPVPDVTLEGLDLDKLNEYIHRLNRTVKVETIKADMAAAEPFLARKSFVREGKVTTLGMLVCGRYPGDYLHFRAQLHGYVDMPGTIAQDKQDFTDNVLPLMENGMAYLQRNIQVGVSAAAGGTARPQYPEQLLRETINNALAHRDYSINRQVIIAIKPGSHISISNPGSFRSSLLLETRSPALQTLRILPEAKPATRALRMSCAFIENGKAGVLAWRRWSICACKMRLIFLIIVCIRTKFACLFAAAICWTGLWSVFLPHSMRTCRAA